MRPKERRISETPEVEWKRREDAETPKESAAMILVGSGFAEEAESPFGAFFPPSSCFI